MRQAITAAFCSVALLAAVLVSAADVHCTAGVLSEDGNVCCPATCASCDDSEQSCGASSSECCASALLKLRPHRPCESSDAPCVLKSVPQTPLKDMLSPLRRRVLSGDPYCSSGKLYGARICCSEACAACGTQNDGCASDAAGEGSCCADVITASELSCNQYGPPCIIDEERFAEPSTPADPWSIHRNSVVSVLTGPDKTVAEREAEYGMTFDAELIYQNVLYLNFTYLQDVMESGKKVQLVIEINDNLANIAAGMYDSQLYNFGLEAAAYGRKISTRILHEINGDWYPWCAFTPGNSIDQFYEAFVRVVNALRGSGADLKIQLAYAAQNAAGYDNPFIDFFEPIKDYVDEVCVSAYNLCGDKYSENKPLRDVMGEWYKQVTWFTDLPICIAEMSSTGHCEGKPAWIADAWDTITNEFTQVRTINWFFENKIDLLNRDYDLNTSSDVQQFVDGFNNFKYATSRVRQ